MEPAAGKANQGLKPQRQAILHAERPVCVSLHKTATGALFNSPSPLLVPASVHALLSTELFYPDLPGGLMRFFRYAPGLVERGVQPEVITLRHRPELPATDHVNGIRIHRYTPPGNAPGPELRPWLLQQALARAQTLRQQGRHAVLQPAMLSHRMVPTLLRARLAGIPAVHNFSLAPEVPVRPPGLKRFRQWLHMSLLLAPFARLIFLSREQHRLYRKYGWMQSQAVNHIPNGVNLERFRPAIDETERRQLRTEHGFAEDEQVVLFVGGIMERKGVDILLEAWNAVTTRHPRAVLAVVGSEAGRISHQRPDYRSELSSYLNRLDALRACLQFPGNVRFLGEHEDPAPFYRLADLFAFPSRREGLPNAVLEAMASGLPSLVARFDGMPHDGEELGWNGRHHLSLGHTPGEWAESLTTWLDPQRREARQNLAAEARRWMETTHPLPRILDTWADLYHTCHSSLRS